MPLVPSDLANLKHLRAKLRRGADPDAAFTIDDNKVTPLYFCSLLGLHQSVDILIRAGASINLRSGEGYLAIHSAADFCSDGFEQLHGKLKCIELLVQANADVNVAGPRGVRPLHIACVTATPEAVELLLKCKANPLMKTMVPVLECCYSILVHSDADMTAKQSCKRLLRKAELEAEDERSFFGRKNSVRAICEMAQALAATDKNDKSPNGASTQALTPRTDDARKEARRQKKAKQKERRRAEAADDDGDAGGDDDVVTIPEAFIKAAAVEAAAEESRATRRQLKTSVGGHDLVIGKRCHRKADDAEPHRSRDPTRRSLHYAPCGPSSAK